MPPDRNPFEQTLPYLGMGLTALGGLYESREYLRAAQASGRARIENAKLYKQNALLESINASKRTAGIHREYKRKQDRIQVTTAASGFRGSGELRREAELNEERAIEQSRYGSAMMARNAHQASLRELKQAEMDMQAAKYRSRASSINTGATLLGQASDIYYNG
jgi:hypothetical protein